MPYLFTHMNNCFCDLANQKKEKYIIKNFTSVSEVANEIMPPYNLSHVTQLSFTQMQET